MKKNFLLILSIFFPWLVFLFEGKPIATLCCLALQLTLVGWIPASIWAYIFVKRQYPSNDETTDVEPNEEMIQEKSINIQEKKKATTVNSKKTDA